MPLPLYDISIPTFLHGLKQLGHFLDKAETFAAARGIDLAKLVSARLADDMLPLSGQIQRASDTSKLSSERLSGAIAPKMPDTERTFDELRARIDATIAYLESISPMQIDGNEAMSINLNFGKWNVDFTGKDYLLQFALPNFHFHVVTAYAILRQAGVPLGKLDYLGRIGEPVER